MLCVLTVLPILRVWPPTRLYLLPLILDYPHLLLVPVVGSMHGKIDVYILESCGARA